MLKTRKFVTVDHSEARLNYVFSAQYDFSVASLGAFYRIPDSDVGRRIYGTLGFTGTVFF